MKNLTDPGGRDTGSAFGYTSDAKSFLSDLIASVRKADTGIDDFRHDISGNIKREQ